MTKTSQPATKTVEKVTAELTASAVPVSAAELANRVGLSPSTTRKALTALMESGQAVRNDDGHYLPKARVEQPVKATKATKITKSSAAKTAKPKTDKRAKLADTMADRDRQAVDLIRQAGADGISVDDLAKALGITNGAARTVRARLSERRSPGTDVEIESAGGGRWRLVGAGPQVQTKARARRTAAKKTVAATKKAAEDGTTDPAS